MGFRDFGMSQLQSDTTSQESSSSESTHRFAKYWHEGKYALRGPSAREAISQTMLQGLGFRGKEQERSKDLNFVPLMCVSSFFGVPSSRIEGPVSWFRAQTQG